MAVIGLPQDIFQDISLKLTATNPASINHTGCSIRGQMLYLLKVKKKEKKSGLKKRGY